MEQHLTIQEIINNAETALGIEFGSTRIKAVLIDNVGTVLSSGEHIWENKLIDGIWTYDIDDVWHGLQDAYKKLADNVREKYSTKLHTVGVVGISAMMHGYLAFGENDNLLVPFRTWRNTNQSGAAKILTEEFSFNIPERWSIAHLYQATLNNEEHVSDISYLTTLAGYVHWKLTGKKVIGIGDASGMFPIDSSTCDYDKKMIACFEKLRGVDRLNKSFYDILPKVLLAGELITSVRQ